MTTIDALREQGDTARRERRLDDAVAAYRQLTEADPANPLWWWSIARVRELQRDDQGCDAASRRAIALEGGPTALDERLLQAGPFELRSRRRVTRFVRAHLNEIRAAAAALEPPGPVQRRRLFVYWGQGFEAAPDIVQRCLFEVRRRHAPDDVVLLTDDNRDEWASVPDDVTAAIGPDDRAHFSDVLRLELLRRHGGVWLDATCLPVTDVLAETVRHRGFFAFQVRPRRPSNWLLAAPPGDPTVALLGAAQRRYWTHFEGPRPYFAMHQLFEALVLSDKSFRQAWRASPRPSADAPHALQFGWGERGDEHALVEALRGCWVHKLTYKFDPAAAADGTILHQLLTSGVPDALDGPVTPADPADGR